MQSRRKFLISAGLLAGSQLIPATNLSDLNSLAEKLELIKPNKLKVGDTIAISSPAGAVWDVSQIDKFVTILKSFEFNVVLGKSLSAKYGYFAGTDEERALELNSFFEDKNIKGIFCMKGGWGCSRILTLLNFKLIKQNPKILIGFSDITTLLNAIYAKTGLITFHGPVGNSSWNDFTSKIFKSIIMKGEKLNYPNGPSTEDKIVTLNKGKATGIIVGGNLSVICSLIGTSYLPDFNGKILFIEETKEEPYRIDRMLTQLKLSGVLNQLNGIVIGKFVKCEAEEPVKAFTTMQVLEQHIKPLNIPVFYGAMIGHIENKLTIPIGINVEMNADLGTISLLDSAVI